MFSGSVCLLSAPKYEENAISSHVQDLINIPSFHAVDGRFARSGLVSLRMARNIETVPGIEITPSGRQVAKNNSTKPNQEF
jgi:tRNA/tmRNA/rRNA uracil-C5-methylase (TrmA/RlmC/RlmD family)